MNKLTDNINSIDTSKMREEFGTVTGMNCN